ncbi:MAG: hypothetical protein OSJ67_07560 [Clostridia bacterium]|nr:hypothetical protein [Clostridia bacterium]
MQIEIKNENGAEVEKNYVSVVLIDGRTLASICRGEYIGAPKPFGGAKTLEEQSDSARYNPEFFTTTLESINPDEEKRTVGGELEQHQVINRKARFMFEFPPLTQEEIENVTHFLRLDKAEDKEAYFSVAYEDMRGLKTGVRMYVHMTVSAERTRRINGASVWHGLELAFIEM